MKKPKYVINTEIENINLSETQEKIVKEMELVYANLIKFKKEKKLTVSCDARWENRVYKSRRTVINSNQKLFLHFPL